MRVVTCRPLQRMKTWKKLENALLVCFREEYGEWPKLNKRVKQAATDAFSYFRKTRLRNVLNELDNLRQAA